MTNKFVIVGKVSVISKDNPDYPGFYIQPQGKNHLVPVSLHKDEDADQVLKAQLNRLQNNMVVGASGEIEVEYGEIKLYMNKLVIIS